MKTIVALLLTLCVLLPVRAQNTDYPFQTQAFTQDASVVQVDPDRDRVQITADDGKAYTLDTYRAAIVLLGTKRAGQTGDLVEGMRVHVTGSLVSGSIVEAARVQVLPFRPPPSAATPPNPNAPVYAAPNNNGVSLRGTVESVDQKRGQFVLRVGDHTRTVHLTRNTDTSALPASRDRVPVRVGDRVEVDGAFNSDNTVDADAVRLARASRAIGPARRVVDTVGGLTGPVVGTSDRLRSRDIKVQGGSGRAVTIHVPRGIPILRDGKPVSVHDLGSQDVVRVDGAPDGDNSLRASAITVIGDVRDAPNSSNSSSQ